MVKPVNVNKCVLLKVTYQPSGNVKLLPTLSDPSQSEFTKRALEIESTTVFKAACLRQDLRPEIGGGYFLMHMPWTSLFLVEVTESNADTQKVSDSN